MTAPSSASGSPTPPPATSRSGSPPGSSPSAPTASARPESAASAPTAIRTPWRSGCFPKLGLSAKHQGAKIGRAEIKGALTVTDPHAFTDALATGVGRARSYSAGLLLVRPAAGA
ncbi:type I-E CRISPR-associated protein Cas6/Cse3/CasE [Kitasatospora aureofaciens]